MELAKKELYQSLMRMPISDENAKFTFAERLARENAWSLQFAKQVIVEYKRFIYLVATTNESQTPSDQVDQAWHLHMTFTDSYWNVMCKGIIGKEIHHGPTRGGAAQRLTYRQQYQNTLLTYRSVFGKEPQSIWPDVDTRFTNATDFVRINTADNWVIPKFKLPQLTLPNIVLPTAITACLAMATASAYANDDGVTLEKLVSFLGPFVLIVIVFGVTLNIIVGKSKKTKGEGSSSTSDSGATGTMSNGSASSKKSDASDSNSDSGDSGCGSGCGGGCGS